MTTGPKNVIVLLLNAQQQDGPMPSSLFSPFPAFVTARSGRQRGLWLVYSDLLRLMRSISRLGGHWTGSWETENYLESQICVFEKSKLNFYNLIL